MKVVAWFLRGADASQLKRAKDGPEALCHRGVPAEHQFSCKHSKKTISNSHIRNLIPGFYNCRTNI